MIKKAFLVLMILSLLVITVFGELPEDFYLELIKKNFPVSYEQIKSRAVAEWGTDHSMILYEITNQCNAVMGTSKFIFDLTYALQVEDVFDEDASIILEIFLHSLELWSYEGTYELNIELAKDGSKSMLDMDVDWVMLLYTMEEQLEALLAY